MPAVTGSAATGQASGAAGLRRLLRRSQQGSPPLRAERDQAAAHDDRRGRRCPRTRSDSARPTRRRSAGTSTSATASPTSALAHGADRTQSKIPPQALITSPDWFAPLNVERSRTRSTIDGACFGQPRAAGYSLHELQWAPGIEPAETDFRTSAHAAPGRRPTDGSLGTHRPRGGARRARRAARAAAPTADPTAPAKGPGDKDPNEPAFTVRVVVTDTAGQPRRGPQGAVRLPRPTLHPGWRARTAARGGEESPAAVRPERRQQARHRPGDSSGELSVLHADGTPLQSFNGGQPVQHRALPELPPGRARLQRARSAARGAAHAGDRRHRRRPRAGDRRLRRRARLRVECRRHGRCRASRCGSTRRSPCPQDRTRAEPRQARVHRPRRSLGDLNGDGRLEIVLPALDQHLYAWDGSGKPVSGFPASCGREPDSGIPAPRSSTRRRSGTSPATASRRSSIPTREFDDNPAAPATPPSGDVAGVLQQRPHQRPRQRDRRQRPRLRARPQRQRAARAGRPSRTAIVPDALPFVGPGRGPRARRRRQRPGARR